ncbi:sulfatase-like hydrolase/transferase [bacterium]|nr:sulfatase-like hydrolase/transferase [bacterium]
MMRPNILWICTDSQRWDTLGCYGNRFVRTPNIDRLAASGVQFDHCYAQNPLCTPSRGCFLTGRYPVTTGLRQNGQDIRASEKLVTKILADNGYVCGLAGKLHLSACDHRIKNFGKDEWWKHPEELFFKGTERRIDDGYAEFYWDHAPSAHFRSSAYSRWLVEKGVKLERRDREDSKVVKRGMPVEHHQTTFCAEKAIGFIKGYEGSPYPWLFSVNIFDPHFTIDPPDEFLAPYLERLDEIPLPNYVEGELDNKPAYEKQFADSGPYARQKMTDRDHRLCRAAYWAMCDLIDVQVGRILDALDETGQRDNTIVIFTSDHGEMLGDHGIYIKGPFMYDPAIRVPLIISFPNAIAGGCRTNALVELGDLAPTLLDAAGLPRDPGMQARSLWPFLTGTDRARFRDDVYCEYYNSNPNKPRQYCTMIRTDTHKIVVWHGQELGELYDVQADPNETRNLWDDLSSANVKMAMMKRACDRMAYTCDPLPERIGIY